MRAELLLFTLLFLFLLVGCTPVKPWQKGTLTKPAMSFELIHSALDSCNILMNLKKLPLVGYGIAGAGCGCK